jgi:hypothetical protein
MTARVVAARIAAIAFLALVPLATVATAAGAASGSVRPIPDDPEGWCRSHVPADILAILDADPRVSFTVGDPEAQTGQFDNDPSGGELLGGGPGIDCRWSTDDLGFPFSVLAVGYSLADPEETALAIERLTYDDHPLAQPAVLEASETGVLLHSDTGQNFSNHSYDYFIEGHWVRVSGSSDPERPEPIVFAPERFRDIALAVGAELVSAPADEPASPAPAPVASTRDLTTPTVLSTLPTIQSLHITALGVATTLTLAGIFIAIVGLPGRLLDAALGPRLERLTAPLAPVKSEVARLRPVLARIPTWVVLTVGIAVASVISAFLDPAFGSGPDSIRLLVTIGLGLVIESLVGMLLIARVVRRNTRLLPRIEFQAGALLLAALAVLVSRLVGFQPGILFGILIGLAFAATTQPTSKEQGEVARLEAAWLLVLGLVSWVLYSVASPLLGPDLIGVGVSELLGTLTVTSISALPIVLLPLRGLAGGAIFAQSAVAWAGAYLVSSIVFVLVLLPFPASWAEVGTPLVAWVVIYIVYAAVAIGGWYALNRWMPLKKPGGE